MSKSGKNRQKKAIKKVIQPKHTIQQLLNELKKVTNDTTNIEKLISEIDISELNKRIEPLQHSVLHEAAEKGNSKIVEMLLERDPGALSK